MLFLWLESFPFLCESVGGKGPLSRHSSSHERWGGQETVASNQGSQMALFLALPSSYVCSPESYQ